VLLAGHHPRQQEQQLYFWLVSAWLQRSQFKHEEYCEKRELDRNAVAKHCTYSVQYEFSESKKKGKED